MRAKPLCFCLLVLGSGAVADEKPPGTKGPEAAPTAGAQHEQATQSKDLQELEKRVREEFLAECQENDRLYKRMVKAKPHDIRAWELLGWNAAYNLSVTSDDIKERYTHVKEGIEHLVHGLTHNPTNAVLYWDIGFYLHNRIGQGDARKPFRKLFRNDKQFHKLLAGQVDLKAVEGPDGLPDNELVAQRWFEKTIAIVEKHGWPAEFPKNVTVLVLNSFPGICQRTHARSIEDDGHFGEAAVTAWKQALKMWETLGEREFVAEDGKKYRLKNNESARKSVNYDYWKQRCLVEQTEPMLTARRALYRAEEYLSGFKGTLRWTWEENLAKQRADFTDEARGRAKQLFDEAFSRLGRGIQRARLACRKRGRAGQCHLAIPVACPERQAVTRRLSIAALPQSIAAHTMKPAARQSATVCFDTFAGMLRQRRAGTLTSDDSSDTPAVSA
jgi:hypothetical protein